MAYKFQFGTARMSGALQQEGNVTVGTGSQTEDEVIGVVPVQGSTQFFAKMKYDGAAESGIIEVTTGSNGATNFFAGANAGGVAHLSGAALDTLAGAALDFNQSTGIMDVTNTGLVGLIGSHTIDESADSIVFVDSSGELKQDTLVSYASKLAQGNGISSGGGRIALDLDELVGTQAVNVAQDSFAFISVANGNASLKETIADLATAMVAGNNGLTATSGVFSVQTSGALGLDGDKIGISGSIAGNGLTFAGGADAISGLSINAATLAAPIASASLDVAHDQIFFIDTSDSNKVAKESVADFATSLVAGNSNALSATNGVLSVGVNSTSFQISSDEIELKSSVAGAGIGLSSHALEVEVSGALKVGAGASGKVGISGSIAGNGLTFAGGADSISALSINAATLAAPIASASLDVAHDQIFFIDTSDSNKVAKESVADFASSLVAGNTNALTATDGVLSVGVNATSFQIASDEIQLKSTVAGDGLTLSSDALKVDPTTLAASITQSGSISVAHDQILFIDADGSNEIKKESLVDYATALAGAGLTATSGSLSVQGNAMNVFTSAGDLSEGYNVQNATTSMTMILPTGSEGDVVTVKAGNLGAGAVLTISRNAGQLKQIDNLNSIEIESPFGAVTLVYASDSIGWRIV